MNKIKSINNNKRKWSWIIISVIFFILAVALALVAYYAAVEFYPDIFGKANKLTSMQVKLGFPVKNGTGKIQLNDVCVDCVRRGIDGVYVKKGEENLYPIAVIIENHADARPPSGLAQANLVFEAEAEGGITRFLAIYAGDQNIEEIGPIRSVRPYFVDWAREFSAVLVHCGGSPEALVKIVKDNILSLNEFYNGSYYWRSKKNHEPHNIYTSIDNLNEYLENKSLDEGKFLSWRFKASPPRLALLSSLSLSGQTKRAAPLLSKEREAKEEKVEGVNIKINFKPPNYVVDWIYDKENNNYIRYLAGERHKDIDGEEIRAKNIVIQYVEAKVIDEEGRLEMKHIGEGKAVVCMDGQCEEGTWQKKSSSARTRFYNKDEDALTGSAQSEFKFNAGTTWIEVVRPEIEVEFK